MLYIPIISYVKLEKLHMLMEWFKEIQLLVKRLEHKQN